MFDRYSVRSAQVLALALWSARRRGGLSIDPEDLLIAIIHEDLGKFSALSPALFPETPIPIESEEQGRRRFFAEDVARNLLSELQDKSGPFTEARAGTLQPAPHVDMPVSKPLEKLLRAVERNETRAS